MLSYHVKVNKLSRFFTLTLTFSLSFSSSPTFVLLNWITGQPQLLPRGWWWWSIGIESCPLVSHDPEDSVCLCLAADRASHRIKIHSSQGSYITHSERSTLTMGQCLSRWWVYMRERDREWFPWLNQLNQAPLFCFLHPWSRVVFSERKAIVIRNVNHLEASYFQNHITCSTSGMRA